MQINRKKLSGVVLIAFVLLIIYIQNSYTDAAEDHSDDKISCEQLIESARTGDSNKSQYLIKSGINVNCKNDEGETPLYSAQKNKQYDIAKLLVTNGADVNEVVWGYSPLILAIWDNQKDMVSLLLQKGANPNKKIIEYPLLSAIPEASLEIIQILLDYGADINVVGSDNVTAISWAAFNGRIDVIELLLKNNIKITEDNVGRAFAIAAYMNQKKMVEYLLNKFNNLIYGTHWHCMALFSAASAGNCDIINYLLDNGMTVDSRCGPTKSETALMTASENEQIEAVKLLIKRGADINAQNNDGLTSLMIAVDYEHLSVVKILVESGADMQMMDNNNETAILKATKNNYKEIEAFLKSKRD